MAAGIVPTTRAPGGSHWAEGAEKFQPVSTQARAMLSVIAAETDNPNFRRRTVRGQPQAVQALLQPKHDMLSAPHLGLGHPRTIAYVVRHIWQAAWHHPDVGVVDIVNLTEDREVTEQIMCEFNTHVPQPDADPGQRSGVYPDWARRRAEAPCGLPSPGVLPVTALVGHQDLAELCVIHGLHVVGIPQQHVFAGRP